MSLRWPRNNTRLRDLQSFGQVLQFGLQRTVTDDEKNDIRVARRQVRGHLEKQIVALFRAEPSDDANAACSMQARPAPAVPDRLALPADSRRAGRRSGNNVMRSRGAPDSTRSRDQTIRNRDDPTGAPDQPLIDDSAPTAADAS